MFFFGASVCPPLCDFLSQHTLLTGFHFNFVPPVSEFMVVSTLVVRVPFSSPRKGQKMKIKED